MISHLGSDQTVDKVLLAATTTNTVVGTPFIDGASLTLTVEEHTKAPKVIIFKKKRRKNYRRWNGHRQEVFLATNAMLNDPLPFS